MRTVVVTGASGFLGQRVVRLLAARSDVKRVVAVDVVPLVVDEPKVDARIVDLARVQHGRPDPLDTAVSEADSAIHLAWITTTATGGQRASDNLRALRRLLEAAERAGVGNVVYLSSATVYGAWPDNQIPLSENAPIRPNPGFGFALEKAEAERVVAEWREEHPEVTTAVLRPAVTVGAAGPPLYRALSGTSGPRSEDTARPMQFLHVDDLAEAVVLAWDKRLGGVYNVAPDHGVAEDTARSLAGGVARVTLPSRLAGVVAAWSWQLWRKGTPKEALPYASNPWVIAGDKLKAEGWTPRYSSEEALVSSDDRSHWSDLPTSRRQEVLLVAGLVVLGLVVAGVPGAAAWYRRRRRRERTAGAQPRFAGWRPRVTTAVRG